MTRRHPGLLLISSGIEKVLEAAGACWGRLKVHEVVLRAMRFQVPSLLAIGLVVVQYGTALGKDGNSGPHWELGASSLTLKGADGTIKTEIPIGSTEQYSPDGFLESKHEAVATVDLDGHHAIVVEKDFRKISSWSDGAKEPGGVATTTVLASFFDWNGKRLWQISNVVSQFMRGPLIGKGGHTLLIQSSAPGCGVESELGCTEQVIVMSRLGKQLGRFPSVAVVTPLMLSPEGSLALIGIAPTMGKWEVIVFRTANPSRFQSFDELPGNPVLYDDGRAEFYKNTYGEMGPNGPIILRRDLVREIKIK